jgi:valyl-tRNA synthetase
MEFGTGVVKITAAHDANDLEVGNRHGLSRINVMNEDATMNELAGEFVGMDRFEVRKAVVKIEGIGHLIKTQKKLQCVGDSERSGGVMSLVCRHNVL